MDLRSYMKGQVKVIVSNPEISSKERFPLRLLVLAEFIPRNEAGEPTSRISECIRVDKETFGQVLTKLVGKVALRVPNRLGGQTKDMRVTLPLSEMKSFRPEAIIEAIPALRDLMQIRQLMVQLQDGKIAYEAFLTQLEQFESEAAIVNEIRMIVTERRPIGPLPSPMKRLPSDQKSPPGEEREKTLESLLGMVDVPREDQGARHTAETLLDHFLSLIGSSGHPRSPIDTRLANQVISDLDHVLSAQVNEILHHPEFRRLEATWRGLKFLVDRTDFREPIQIDLLSTSKATLGETFKVQVFQPEYEGIAQVPASIMIAEYEFDRSLQDIELLQELGREAEILQVPFISSIGPAFLGLDSIGQFDRLPSLRTLFGQPDYIKWKAFRQGGPSRWVALLFNRFLLRMPYGPEGNQVKTLDFRESLSGVANGDYLWGNPVWGLASLLTTSFARTGWCTDITGVRGGGVIENLPVYEVRIPGTQKVQIPLEVIVSEQRQIEFAENGIMVLTCRFNSDAAVVLSAPTTHLPERYSDRVATTRSMIQATLPYQIVAGRFSHYAGRIASQMGQGKSLEVIQRTFTEALSTFLTVSGGVFPDAVDVKVKESEEHPDRYDVSLTIWPDRAGMGGLSPVELTLQIHK